MIYLFNSSLRKQKIPQGMLTNTSHIRFSLVVKTWFGCHNMVWLSQHGLVVTTWFGYDNMVWLSQQGLVVTTWFGYNNKVLLSQHGLVVTT